MIALAVAFGFALGIVATCGIRWWARRVTELTDKHWREEHERQQDTRRLLRMRGDDRE